MTDWHDIFHEQPTPGTPHHPEPHPCPFCGIRESVIQQCNDVYRVRCPICKATGPEMKTSVSAVHSWAWRK